MTQFEVAAFYKFVRLSDHDRNGLRRSLLDCCLENAVKGTILLAPEGINSTVAGSSQGVSQLLSHLRADPRFADLEVKTAQSDDIPFKRMKVRLKREIITMNEPDIDPKQAGQYVKPGDWNELISRPDMVLIDTRNTYEVAVGTFDGAIDPELTSFSELPQWLDEYDALDDKPPVAMFCTGGIRCEKSTALLRERGFDEVYHLEGGILNYLEQVPNEESRWRGECFVFDRRVTVDQNLQPGRYELCDACGHPIDAQDKARPDFIAGEHCLHCPEASQ